MKTGFYLRLAKDGIRKNKRMYLPYILTCIGMVMMAYIISFVRFSPIIRSLKGGETIQMIMQMGVVVITFFATLFLFYTNSFLIKRRKKEFGLYNILGMDKINLSRIIFWESVYIMILSLTVGLFFGIVFSKLAELGMVNMMKGNITYSMSLPIKAVIGTIIPFVVIFILIFVNSIIQIWTSSAISLLRSENTGEKPPKANWFLGILGIIILVAAYYIAISIKDPIVAINAFFIAVLMVIAATYMIMIAGSVMFCRILQRKKDYYYKANHFVSVSSMVYRMKRNGAGLASICILSTMVLVIISSTSALFIGSEDTLHKLYPREIDIKAIENTDYELKEENKKNFYDEIDKILQEKNIEISNMVACELVSTSGFWNGEELYFDSETFDNLNIMNFSNVYNIYLMSLEEYNRLMGENETLENDEMLVYSSKTKFDSKTFRFHGLSQYHVKSVLSNITDGFDNLDDICPSMILVVSDVSEAVKGIVDVQGNKLSNKEWIYNFDTSLDAQENIILQKNIKEKIQGIQGNVRIESREESRQDYYSLYGGLLYLGIILSIAFVFAAVLIIYYKQISEGYEDESRFEIMQKIGMTKKNIKKSINSQLLTVFFLPLVFAGLHLGFAFPILEKLLMLFRVSNHRLLIGTTIISFLSFAFFYAIVYRITSNAYYKIVSKTD